MSHLNIASEASYVTFWVDKSSLKCPKWSIFVFEKPCGQTVLPDVTLQKFIKNAKNDPFWRVFENLAVLTDRSLLKGQKK